MFEELPQVSKDLEGRFERVSGPQDKILRESLPLWENEKCLRVLQSCASSPSGWWQFPCLTLGYCGIRWGRAWSPPKRLSPHTYSHQQPSFLFLLLLGVHILCSHLPAPSVISHTSPNGAFPGPDSPAGMAILPFPPNPLSSPPTSRATTNRKEGWQQTSSLQHPWSMGELEKHV